VTDDLALVSWHSAGLEAIDIEDATSPIGLAEWREYLRRDLLRGRPTGASDVRDDDVSAAIGVEAICSGLLEAAAAGSPRRRARAPGNGAAGAPAGGGGRGRGAARISAERRSVWSGSSG
jgi:hypothetical protein